MRFLTLALAFCVLAACERIDVARIFEAYQWEKRVLVVLAPEQDSEALRTQWQMIQAQQQTLKARDIVVWVLVHDLSVTVDGEGKPHLFTRPFYEYFKADPEDFTVILLGKDGDEKLRQTEPLKASDLLSVVDDMPMRKREMKALDAR